MTRHWVADQLFTRGMIQFGRFRQENSVALMRMQLEFAASYPQFLNDLADEMLSLLDIKGFERLVSTIDAVPLASLLSVKTGVPLVYSRGSGNFTSADLIGAYYVGHPACLVLLDGQGAQQHMALWIKNALAAGLQIECVVGVIGEPTRSAVAANYLFTTRDLLQSLSDQRLVPPHVVQSVLSQRGE